MPWQRVPMLKRTTKVLLPLGIVALAVAVALAMVNSRQPLAKAEAAPLLPKVRTVAVALGEVTPSIVAHGNVTARHELELVSEVSGRVEWIAPEFEPGQLVATGQVLVRIDAINYRLALAEARAALASASLTLADSRAVKRQAAIEEGELRVEAARQAAQQAQPKPPAQAMPQRLEALLPLLLENGMDNKFKLLRGKILACPSRLPVKRQVYCINGKNALKRRLQALEN